MGVQRGLNTGYNPFSFFVTNVFFCSTRTRTESDQDKLHVAFTIPVKKVTGITNICVKEEEEVCQERWAKQNVF